MSIEEVSERSFAPLTDEHLRRLVDIAAATSMTSSNVNRITPHTGRTIC